MGDQVNVLSVVVIAGFSLYLIWYSVRILIKGDFTDKKDLERYSSYTEESRKQYAKVSSLMILCSALFLIGAALCMVFVPDKAWLYWLLVGLGFAVAVGSFAVMFAICKERPKQPDEGAASVEEDEEEEEKILDADAAAETAKEPDRDPKHEG